MIEVLAALVIFSVAIVAILEGFGTTSAIEVDARDARRAETLAQNVLEETSLDRDLKADDTRGNFKGADANFEWRQVIQETETPDLMAVTVTITWDSGRGARDYELSTQLMRRGRTE